MHIFSINGLYFFPCLENAFVYLIFPLESRIITLGLLAHPFLRSAPPPHLTLPILFPVRVHCKLVQKHNSSSVRLVQG